MSDSIYLYAVELGYSTTFVDNFLNFLSIFKVEITSVGTDLYWDVVVQQSKYDHRTSIQKLTKRAIWGD